jgi:hypothetical protein
MATNYTEWKWEAQLEWSQVYRQEPRRLEKICSQPMFLMALRTLLLLLLLLITHPKWSYRVFNKIRETSKRRARPDPGWSAIGKNIYKRQDDYKWCVRLHKFIGKKVIATQKLKSQNRKEQIRKFCVARIRNGVSLISVWPLLSSQYIYVIAHIICNHHVYSYSGHTPLVTKRSDLSYLFNIYIKFN